MQKNKKLPIGIQTFEKIAQNNYCYVDKTHFVRQLLNDGTYYFLSRPRRFGKSLFLSTLKAAFEGRRELFQGLFLYDNWDWSQNNPVVHISFGSGVMRSVRDLEIRFSAILDNHIRLHGLQLRQDDLRERFAELIQTLYENTGRRVVVLVDEYDKPILDSIENTEMAIALREELKNFYSVIKDADPYIEFVFITGVSKFSKVSLFSGLNNLKDISIDKRFSDICGYTQEELENVFSGWIGDDVDLAKVKTWYNGYNWLGQEVYNPFDILLYLDSGEFRNFWFETATPTFLIRILQKKKYYIPALHDLRASEKILDGFDVERMEIETLLFQTGYLTIRETMHMGGMHWFQLGYPNQEVRQSLNDYILSFLTDTTVAQENNKFALYEALSINDFHALKEILQAFFSSIPHDWYRKNQLANYEGYYASIVYCYFAALGLDLCVEDATNHGRIDMTVKLGTHIYIFEFKVVELLPDGSALQQIKNKDYAGKYRTLGATIHLIGVAFSSKERNVVDFEVETEKH
ncbi:ATP-binding protein [Desulfobacter vibrioformis]|uniref:ATP-binding protein n=1 Tax=Desulfobacter vibrioformis TaxID=34031 RepID=UPI000554CF0F|nr:ATP-binding protein [Desulfobacter vibrioformis]